MKFISHAQNFEDVILNRAIGNLESGFYVDVGAWSPKYDSVTKSFYDKGWSGINVEPNEKYYKELEKERPRDRNICMAIGDAEGTSEMSFLGGFGSGMSTMIDEYAEKHVRAGWEIERRVVIVTTLAKVWGDLIPKNQTVHFLKIDTEGMEKAVIRGNDWNTNRPWIVIVEATLPMTQIECHDEWESDLIAAHYIYAYADGLNRFYVTREKVDLLKYFKCPPNVFDNFTLGSTIEANQNVERLMAENKEINASLAKMSRYISEVSNRHEEQLEEVEFQHQVIVTNFQNKNKNNIIEIGLGHELEILRHEEGHKEEINALQFGYSENLTIIDRKHEEKIANLIVNYEEKFNKILIENREKLKEYEQEHEGEMIDLIVRHEEKINAIQFENSEKLKDFGQRHDEKINELIVKQRRKLNEIQTESNQKLKEYIQKYEEKITDLIVRHEEEIDTVKDENEKELTNLSVDHQQVINKINFDNYQKIIELGIRGSARMTELRECVGSLGVELSALKAIVLDYQKTIEKIQASNSWRITYPFRKLKSLIIK